MTINVQICGNADLHLEHLVLDINGTLAVDGALIAGVDERVQLLTPDIRLHLLSSDTHNTADAVAAALRVDVTIVEPPGEAEAKADFVRRLGSQHVAAIGNGANDTLMVAVAQLGICVIGEEGAQTETLLAADIVAPNITAALDLFLKPSRLMATLRR
jgi:P-type E1-E2 ATPase